MKTAVSIPDKLFRNADRYAKRRKLNRSQLYCIAIEEYLKRHSREEMARQLEVIVDDLNREFSPADARRSVERLRSVEW